jgi:hypothetical protein
LTYIKFYFKISNRNPANITADYIGGLLFNKDKLLSLFKTFLDENISDQPTVEIIKQFDEEKMEAVEVLYCPPDQADLHQEAMTEDEIVKMVDNLNAAIKKGRVKGNIAHAVNTDKIYPVEAWVNKVACDIGGKTIPAGMPLIKMKFTDRQLWEERKSGKLKGVSMGARGERVEVKND